MKVVHFSQWGPRVSGLYECTKDQIKYERKHGIDAQLAFPDHDRGQEILVDDGWLSPIFWKDCRDADLYIIHRGLPEELRDKESPKKTIFIAHGTAEFVMIDEVSSHAEKPAFNAHINNIFMHDASVAVNPHDYDIYKIYDGKDRLNLIHDGIDIEKFTVDGYQHPYANHPQILYCDSVRVNKHPAHVMWAMQYVLKQIPEARLSVVGLPLRSITTWRNLILRSPNQCVVDGMEEIQLISKEIRPYMRGADILVNGNMSGIPSRVELEAMASGCQVISYSGDFTKYHPRPFDVKDIAAKICECWEAIKKDRPAARIAARDWVLKNANMEKQVVEKYIPLYEKTLGAKNP
jgi:glycosyltransferase involved in cell wall biosynthesis